MGGGWAGGRGVGRWEGGEVGGGGVGGGGGWEAGVQEVLVIGPDTTGGPQETSHQHRGEYQTHTSHLVPPMGPIVSVVTSHGRQNQL